MLRTTTSTVVAFCLLTELMTFTRAQTITIGENFIAITNPGESPTAVADTMGAVGVDHFVAMTNQRYVVFEKAGHTNIGSLTIEGFWEQAGASGTGDPRVVYDHASGRWFAAALSSGNFGIAVSNGTNPAPISSTNVNWTGFSITTPNIFDQPKLGVGAQGVFLTGWEFEYDDVHQQYVVLGDNLYSFPKAGLVNSGTITGYTGFGTTSLASGGTSQYPAVSYESLGATHPMLSLEDFDTPQHFRTTINNPAGTVSLSTPFELDTPDFVPTGFGGIVVRQANGPDLLVREPAFASSPKQVGDSLWAVHIIKVSGERSAIQWYELDANGDTIQSDVIEEAG